MLYSSHVFFKEHKVTFVNPNYGQILVRKNTFFSSKQNTQRNFSQVLCLLGHNLITSMAEEDNAVKA